MNEITIYVRDLEYQKVQEELLQYLKKGTGVLINLSQNPIIIKSSGEIIPIISCTATYRKGDTVKFYNFEGFNTTTNVDGDLQILLINTDPANSKLYISAGETLVFYPDYPEVMAASNNSDFANIYFATENYWGIVTLEYINGKQAVFSTISTDYYGDIISQVVEQMGSLAININTLQTLQCLQSENFLEIEQRGGIEYELQ